jgi:RHS repeat-associated protein
MMSSVLSELRQGYEYDVFGAIRNETGTSDNTRKFTGKEFDADSNLYYYGARYYDPYIGRFTQRDPAGDGVNWYAYTANNPLKYTDPTGCVA